MSDDMGANMTNEQLLDIVSPVEMTARYVREVTTGEWPHHKWAVTLIFEGRSYTCPYHTSLAQDRYRHPPFLLDVLACLLSDASGTEGGFVSWADDCGYDTDSRKALAIYKRCKGARKALMYLFGAERYVRLCESER